MDTHGGADWDLDPTIWRLAAELIAQYGDEAPDIGAEMVKVLIGRGEIKRAHTWTRILKTARVLLRSKTLPVH